MPRQPRSFRVEAIVLKHSDYGEADRFLSLYTRQRGKLRLDKRVRSSRARCKMSPRQGTAGADQSSSYNT
ncbi:MAG: recombination protein O N-terminal domain-containing protein [Chloroflexi bacterium]|nr:recombination protein O N-terminal domain-containing protein [Chloroflexota bacterium]